MRKLEHDGRAGVWVSEAEWGGLMRTKSNLAGSNRMNFEELEACRAEVAALREQLEVEKGQTAYWQGLWEGQHAAKLEHWSRADAAEARVALLEGLLYTPDYAETNGLSPYVADGARCVRCQSLRGQGHQDFCPVGKYENALPAATRAEGEGS